MIGAKVIINGGVIAPSWDGRDLVALSNLEIPWGREDAYDDTEPSTMSMRVIDPTGGWAADTARIGQTVIVTRTDNGRIMFRGRIATLASELVRVYSERYGHDVDVWEVAITATDVLGELAMARVPGTAVATDREGEGGWTENQAYIRGQKLWDNGVNQYLTTMYQYPEFITPSIRLRLRGVNSDRKLSLLELIAGLYRSSPLGFVVYDAHENGVRPGTWAAQTPIRLQVTAGKVFIVMPGATRVPASKVLTPDGYGLRATVADAIDYVQVHYTSYVPDPDKPGEFIGTFNEPVYERPTDHVATATGRRVAVVESEVITLDPALFGEGAREGIEQYNRYPAYLAGEVVPIVNGLNDQMRLPTIRFDFGRVDYGDATDALLNPIAQAVPLSFPGSVFNRFWNVGPQFQIIGGVLRYDRGWTHDVNMVAAAPQGSPIRVDQIAPNTDVTFNDFDDSVTLTELGTVTQGLA